MMMTIAIAFANCQHLSVYQIYQTTSS